MSTNCQSNEIMLNIVQYRSNVGQSSNYWLSQIYTRSNFVGLFNDKKINSRIVSSFRTLSMKAGQLRSLNCPALFMSECLE